MIPRGLILSIDKPGGWTSFDVVNKLRGALRWKRVGHAGTLDPPATGVLIVLFGTATMRAEEFMDLPKEYLARVRFGIRTTTDDMVGEVLETREIQEWSPSRIHLALAAFEGEIEQVPPAVSAVKVQGQRSYAAVRRGKPVCLRPRGIVIYRIELLEAEQPDIVVRVVCSRGTYIRALARDLGAALGYGGTLATLVRAAVGPYRVERALALSDVLNRRAEFLAK